MTQRHERSKPIPINRQDDKDAILTQNNDDNCNDRYGSAGSTGLWSSTTTTKKKNYSNSNLALLSSSANTASTYSITNVTTTTATTTSDSGNGGRHSISLGVSNLVDSVLSSSVPTRWSMSSSNRFNNSTSNGRYSSEGHHNNISADENDDDGTFFISKSPLSRPSSLWNVDGTITPMTSRPHFCSIQVVHQQQHPQHHQQVPNNPLIRHESSGLDDNTIASSPYRKTIYSNIDSYQSTNDNQQQQQVVQRQRTDSGIHDDIEVTMELTSPNHNKSFLTSHNRIYGSGDMLLLPSLLAAQNAIIIDDDRHLGYIMSSSARADQDDQYKQLQTTGSFLSLLEHDITNNDDDNIVSTTTNSNNVNNSQVQSCYYDHVQDSYNDDNKNIDDNYDNYSKNIHSTITMDDNDQLPKADSAVQLDNKSGNETTIIMCILYGCINASIVLPVLMSFGSIIYRDDAFNMYQEKLISLTLFSGIVHQISFSTFSSLPFAVGQVQDAGLIFLSSMATTIVAHCQSKSYDNVTDNDTVMLATVTIILGCSTAVLGLALIIIGRFKLAQYVQLLPTGVVGGYLAFIGWFCGISGIGLMANSSEVNLHVLFFSNDSLQKMIWILPGVVCGLLIYFSVITIRHMAVLPTFMVIFLITFHVILWCTGTSLQEATNYGWIRNNNGNDNTSDSNNASTVPKWLYTWDYLKIHYVDWSVVPKLLLTELSMIFVVALSSSLDVAAIDLELQEQAHKIGQPLVPLPLDYNRELQTVGLSNVLSGLTGGYTGSYIFSQSIFSLRAGIRSRLAGYVLALCQFIVMILPVPLLSFVPNFLFGSLLIVICVDLMYEWLWHVRRKVTTSDFVLAWITFIAIQVFGNVEYGIIAGVIIHIVYHKLVSVYTTIGTNSFIVDTNNSFDSAVKNESIHFVDNGNDKSQQTQDEGTNTTTTTTTTTGTSNRTVNNYGSIS